MAYSMPIGRQISLPNTTTGSFDQELRELLWVRCLKGLWIGFAVSLIVVVAGNWVFRDEPSLLRTVSENKTLFFLGHPLSFALALGAIYALGKRACAMKLQVITFLVFAFNIGLITFYQLACNPDTVDYFSLSLLLFIPAAFIPWKSFHQLLLGAVGLLAFLVTQFWGLSRAPEVLEFWNTRGEGMSFYGFVGMSTLGIVILALVSFTISKTLYTLNKTVHNVRNLGNYIVEGEIGAGGMGKVLLARHRLICRPSAVKVMSVPEGETEVALARFEREVHLSAHLTHPNTISIYDYGRSGDNTFYYAMEYLTGMDLQSLVERFGPLPPERVAFLLLQVTSSLAEAHGKRIVHRDIKPSNIFLTERGGLHDFVKVLDFGLAKKVRAPEASAVSKTGLIFGTPRYISPEALYGEQEIDGRSDLYNLGGVAYWLLTGQPPFDTSSSVDLIIDHVKSVPARPSAISETPIPAVLEDIVMKCLEKKASDRFQSAEELHEALKAADLGARWSWEKAKDWWVLHGLDQDEVPTCY